MRIHRIVYIAHNTELTKQHKARGIAFKIGYTDRHITARLRELNGKSFRFKKLHKYGGNKILKANWHVKTGDFRIDRTRLIGKTFEEIVKEDLQNFGATLIEGYTTKAQKGILRSTEIYLVPSNFKSKYLCVRYGKVQFLKKR